MVRAAALVICGVAAAGAPPATALPSVPFGLAEAIALALGPDATPATAAAAVLDGHCVGLAVEQTYNLTSGRICHNATDGVVALRFSDALERAVLLRVGGPHPQTHLFDRTASTDAGGGTEWVATFRLCQPGMYTAHAVHVTEPRPSFTRDACPVFHKPGSVLVKRYEWHLPDAAAANASSCAGGLWRWQGPERPPLHHQLEAGSTGAGTEHGIWHGGSELRNRSRALNLRPHPPVVGAAAARDSLATINLTGRLVKGRRHGHLIAELGHVWSLDGGLTSLASTFSALSWTHAWTEPRSEASYHQHSLAEGPTRLAGEGAVGGRTSSPMPRRQQHVARHGGRWRSGLAPGTCLCLVGDSAMRNVANRLVQRWSVECNQEVMQDTHATCATEGALALIWVRFGLEHVFRSPPTNATAASLLAMMLPDGEPAGSIAGNNSGEPAPRRREQPLPRRCNSCAAVVANIGRWGLGVNRGMTAGNPGHLPWSFGVYAAQTDKFARWLGARPLSNSPQHIESPTQHTCASPRPSLYPASRAISPPHPIVPSCVASPCPRSCVQACVGHPIGDDLDHGQSAARRGGADDVPAKVLGVPARHPRLQPDPRGESREAQPHLYRHLPRLA